MISKPQISLLVVVWALSGCSRISSPVEAPSPSVPPAPEAKVVFPALGEPVALQPGVIFQEATLVRGTVPMKVWIYLPEKAPAAKLPCVLVAPAGSPLFLGMDLGEGDRAEHVPYVKAGFAVVSYEIGGHVPNFENAANAQIFAGANAFKNARAGLANASTALDFALEKVPALDSKRIYSAGHSSAATLSLLVASNDPRIKACVAFAPVTNVSARLAPAVRDLSPGVAGFQQFINDYSPINQAAKLTCPVFLFHARNDTTVSPRESEELHARLKPINPQVTFIQVPGGGHYDSMIQQGIPQAIQWLKKLPVNK